MTGQQQHVHVNGAGQVALPMGLALLMQGREFLCDWDRDGDAIMVTFTLARGVPADTAPPEGSHLTEALAEVRSGHATLLAAADVVAPDTVKPSRDKAPVEATSMFVAAWRNLDAPGRRAVADTIHGIAQPVQHPSLDIRGTPTASVYTVMAGEWLLHFTRSGDQHPVWLTLTRSSRPA